MQSLYAICNALLVIGILSLSVNSADALRRKDWPNSGTCQDGTQVNDLGSGPIKTIPSFRDL